MGTITVWRPMMPWLNAIWQSVLAERQTHMFLYLYLFVHVFADLASSVVFEKHAECYSLIWEGLLYGQWTDYKIYVRISIYSVIEHQFFSNLSFWFFLYNRGYARHKLSHLLPSHNAYKVFFDALLNSLVPDSATSVLSPLANDPNILMLTGW